ncbi:MAG: hypothetical protein CM15mP52_2100 [Candidatus Neomarinimicrobiota bacterium]|nr:MAG: hypothetical protein CM15mP52_2100 [Candidatus Neomarinimicrobiota bacterium]
MVKEKFAGKDAIIEANTASMHAGYNYADTTEILQLGTKLKKHLYLPGHIEI